MNMKEMLKCEEERCFPGTLKIMETQENGK